MFRLDEIEAHERQCKGPSCNKCAKKFKSAAEFTEHRLVEHAQEILRFVEKEALGQALVRYEI